MPVFTAGGEELYRSLNNRILENEDTELVELTHGDYCRLN